MPMSRVQKNCMRSDKSPKSGTPNPGIKGDDKPGSTRQHTFPKVKNSAPRYKQADPRTEGKSGPLK